MQVAKDSSRLLRYFKFGMNGVSGIESDKSHGVEMLGLTETRISRKVANKFPTLPPPPPAAPTEKSPRQVFLERSVWAELKDAAKFHTETFRLMNPAAASVSRNEIVENFVNWALGVYWTRVGGKPKNAAERGEKMKTLAVELRKEQAAKDKKAPTRERLRSSSARYAAGAT